MSAYVYSSETGTWGEPAVLPDQIASFTYYASVLVGNSLLYFLSDGEEIQEYDLARHSLTVFDAPDNSFEQKFNLMLGENGELVVSESINGRLILWSRELSGGTGGAGWVPSRVICLENILPNDALVDSVHVMGFAEGANSIFLSTVAGLFMIELQSDRARKVCDDHGFCNLIPVVGFYTPLSRDERQNLPPSSIEEAGVEDVGDLEKTFDQAQQLFDKGFNAIKEGDFVNDYECVCYDLHFRFSCFGKRCSGGW
uniref:Uncharacterized protein n=1 Tax=Avena sativa TaxID=4498 RepID=A0ACD5X669_AVESA